MCILIKIETLRIVQDTIVISVLKLFPVIAYNNSRQIRFRLQETLHGRRWNATIYDRRIQRVPQTVYRVVFAIAVKKYLSLAQLAKFDHTLDIVEFQSDSTEGVKVVLLQVVHHTTGAYVIERLAVQQGKHHVCLWIQ